MRRRALLAGLSTGLGVLAGCSAPLGESADPATTTPTNDPADPPTTSSDSRSADDELELDLASVIDLETATRTYALTPVRYRSDDDASIQMRFTSTATAEGPATVEATLINENQFENTFRLERTPPFGRLVSDTPRPMGERTGDHTYRAGFVFAPTENHELVDDPPEIERGSDGYWRLSGGETAELPEQARLAPGETVRGEYALVGRADGEGHGRPPGVYEFPRGGDTPVRVTVWDTDAPGPNTESRFADVSVPALPWDREATWFHEADSTTPTFVRPSVEQTDLPARVEFTFFNRSQDSTSCGHWDFYKFQDGEWFHLGPSVQTMECRILPPGKTKNWTISADSGEMVPTDAPSYPFLGGGLYAAVVGFGHATGRSGALVEFDAPSISVIPTDGVTTERDSGTVTATSDHWRKAPDSERRTRAKLVLEQVSTADRRLIAEQVMRRRNRGLRNTLAFAAPDVERVVLRTNDRTADRANGWGDDTAQFWYEDQAYRLTKSSP